jgi:hypothetical protein
LYRSSQLCWVAVERYRRLTNNAITAPANNFILTFADGTPLPGPTVLGSSGGITPITDRGVISNGPTLTSTAVPGIQVEGWFAGDPTKEARFLLRFPDAWNGKLVVAGASGTRSEFNGDWAWSDYVLPKGYAYASQNKGVLNLYIAALGTATQPSNDPLACRLNPSATTWVHFYDNDPAKPFTQWTQYMLLTATLAQQAAKVSYNLFRSERMPWARRTAAIKCGGQWKRRRIFSTVASN